MHACVYAYLDVRASEKFWIHHVSLAEERLAQSLLAAAEALGDQRQVPHGLDGRLGHEGLSVGLEDVSIGLQTTNAHGVLHLREIDVSLGHSDGGTDVIALLVVRLEDGGDDVAPGIDGGELLGVEP